MPTTTTPASQVAEYLYPDTWTNLTDKTSNYAAGFPDWANQTYENWYDQPLSTGQTPNLSTAYGNMMNSGALAAATPYINQAHSLYQQGAQYDPNQLQQYLNPYQAGANQATINESNRNLFNNILPGVNSTFAGTGQFGSSRNADFTNRAIQNQQQTLTDVLAKQNANNYATANQNYLNWAQQGNQAASGLSALGSQQATLGQQDLTNQMTAATNQQQLLQAGLDKNYQDWITQQQFPTGALSAVSTAIGNMSKGVQPNVSTPVTQPDTVSRVLAAIQAMSSGLNDTSIQSLLSQLFPTDNAA